MPEKRGEVVEEFEAGSASAEVPAGGQDDGRVEGEIDNAEVIHEKAHRRKRGKSSH